jgi:hypothetical protein
MYSCKCKPVLACHFPASDVTFPLGYAMAPFLSVFKTEFRGLPTRLSIELIDHFDLHQDWTRLAFFQTVICALRLYQMGQ